MRAALLCLLASLATSSAHAARSLEVAPTTLELRSGEPGLLYVTNQSTAPVTIQIDIYDWKQSQNSDHLVLSDTAFLSPPLTTIAPGERQIIRVLAQPRQSISETAYRVRVSELPAPSVKANGVQVLVQFSIPVFVRGSGNGSAIAWSADRHGNALELTAQNNGDHTLKLAGLKISSPDVANRRSVGGRRLHPSRHVAYLVDQRSGAGRASARRSDGRARRNTCHC